MAENPTTPPEGARYAMPSGDDGDSGADDPFLRKYDAGRRRAVSAQKMWQSVYGEAPAFPDKQEDPLAYIVPSDAFDPNPPVMENGELFDVARERNRQLMEELEMAFAPLLKSFGPSIDKLSRFGYSEQNLDPFADDVPKRINVPDLTDGGT